MECKECFKVLNEMTVFCDRCGAQVQQDKMKFDLESLEKLVVIQKNEDVDEISLNNTICNSYFLSSIRENYKGLSRKYIDQYIDYTLLKIYYDQNRRFMTTSEFPIQKACSIYEAFVKKRFNKRIYDILETEFSEHYQEKTVPTMAIRRVQKIYIPNFDLALLKPFRLLVNSLMAFLVQLIKSVIIFGGGFLLAIQLSPPVQDIPYVVIIVSAISILFALITGFIKVKYVPLKDIIIRDKKFKNNINKEIKVKYKILKQRIKKGGSK